MPYAFDPELEPVLGMMPQGNLDDVVGARAVIDGILAAMNSDVDAGGVDVEDRRVPGHEGGPDVGVRVYRPAGVPPTERRPALLDIHGGGFVMGTIAMEHAFCVAVVRRLGVVVVTVEYRLAPEHPFPAGIHDCYAALTWMHDAADELGVDRARIGIGGQSAGGGLAAGTALYARDRGGPAICFQFLGIPELDHRLETPSMLAFTDTPMWSRPQAVRSWEYYLGPDHDGPVSPYASPAVADDLVGLPPAYVTTMEFDPLRDEGIVYALRMLQAGVQVELHSFPGTFHGSSMVPTAAVSRRASEELLVALERGLRARS